MNEQDLKPIEWRDNPWLSGLFRPVLIALVATTLMAGPLAMMVALTTWRVGHMLPLSFIVALEGVYSTLQLGRPQWRERRGMLFRLGEVILLLLLARFATWGFATGLPGLSDAARWLRNPGSFFDNPFLGAAALALSAWAFAVRNTVDFMDLALQPDEYAAQAAVQRRFMRWGDWTQRSWGSAERAFRPVPRSEVMRGLMGRWAWGGILLVFLVAAARVDLGMNSQGGLSFGITQTGLAPGSLAALVIYFLAGFLLLSEARLAVLRASWYNQEVQVAPKVLGRWQVMSVLALLAVGLMAAALPLGSTAGVASGLELILAFMIQLVYFFLALLIFLFGLLLLPFRWLFTPGQAELPRPDQIFQVPTQQEAVSRLPEWLGGLIFWLLVAAIVAYLAYTYLNAHGAFRGRPAALLRRLRYWWRARWARFWARAQAAGASIRAHLPRLTGPPLPGMPRGRLVRPGALPPRARVRYFYLSAVRRAEQRGVARPPHETPLEFEQQLRREWPDAEEDVDALTGAFIEARYNTRPIDDRQARGVQRVWQRALRAIARGPGRR